MLTHKHTCSLQESHTVTTLTTTTHTQSDLIKRENDSMESTGHTILLSLMNACLMRKVTLRSSVCVRLNNSTVTVSELCVSNHMVVSVIWMSTTLWLFAVVWSSTADFVFAVCF